MNLHNCTVQLLENCGRDYICCQEGKRFKVRYKSINCEDFHDKILVDRTVICEAKFLMQLKDDDKITIIERCNNIFLRILINILTFIIALCGMPQYAISEYKSMTMPLRNRKRKLILQICHANENAKIFISRGVKDIDFSVATDNCEVNILFNGKFKGRIKKHIPKC